MKYAIVLLALICSVGAADIKEPIRVHSNEHLGYLNLRLADFATCPVILIQNCTNVVIDGLVIDGNKAKQTNEFWHGLSNNGISILNSTNIEIRNCIVHDCRSGGLVCSETSGILVTNLIAYDNQFDGLACYKTTASLFTGLYLSNNICAGISLDLSFDLNKIEHAELNDNDLGVFMRDSADNAFSDLVIHSKRYDIYLEDVNSRPGTECKRNTFKVRASTIHLGKTCQNNKINE